jgi:hypothetical protein
MDIGSNPARTIQVSWWLGPNNSPIEHPVISPLLKILRVGRKCNKSPGAGCPIPREVEGSAVPLPSTQSRVAATDVILSSIAQALSKVFV